MQSEAAEREEHIFLNIKTSPTETSQKATRFFVTGGAAGGISSYRVYLRKSFLNL